MARFDRTIPPGGEGTISLEVNTKDKQGTIHQTARVFTNDSKTSELTIGMQGNVWAPIHVHPQHARFKGVLGEKIGTVVRLKGQKEDPLTLKLDAVTITDKVDVVLKETEKGRTWELRVDNKVNQETDYEGQVKLTTSYPERPEMVIRISGNIRPLVQTDPKTLRFDGMSVGQIQQSKAKGTQIQRTVTVFLNKGTDLKINDTDLDGSAFKVVDIGETWPGKIHKIRVEAVLEKLTKGINTDTLKIHTNQKGSGVLEVPIRFEVI